jgi:hypothetical protein
MPREKDLDRALEGALKDDAAFRQWFLGKTKQGLPHKENCCWARAFCNGCKVGQSTISGECSSSTELLPTLRQASHLLGSLRPVSHLTGPLRR